MQRVQGQCQTPVRPRLREGRAEATREVGLLVGMELREASLGDGGVRHARAPLVGRRCVVVLGAREDIIAARSARALLGE